MINYQVIADTIRVQLGGGRFVAMTGAKNFSYTSKGNGNLTFHLPNTRNKVKAKYVRIELTPADLYTISYLDKNANVLRMDEMIYCDALRSNFEIATGLAVSL